MLADAVVDPEPEVPDDPVPDDPVPDDPVADDAGFASPPEPLEPVVAPDDEPLPWPERESVR